MKHLTINQPEAADKHEIARLIAAINSEPTRHCLHCDQSVDGILEEMALLEVPVEASFFTTRENGRITGVLGADLTLEKDRAWLWGPFVAGQNREETAAALYNQFLETFSPFLRQMNQFLNQANEEGQAFYLVRDFVITKISHVYRALPPAIPSHDEPLPEIIPPEWRSFIALHEAAFPGTYYNGRQVIERLGNQDKVFVAADGERVLGYVYAGVEPTEGFIHFLAVDEAHRGQGLGRRLLMTAVNWLFEAQKVPHVALVVDDVNDARRLYERCGFNLLHTGVGMRKELGGGGEL